MTQQQKFSIGATDAAQPGYPGAAALSGLSVIATRLGSVAGATAGRRVRLLHHRRTSAAGQNGTLVSQYLRGLPSRDAANELPSETQAGVMVRIFGSPDARRSELLR
jgi:hypothetical protein